MPTEHLPDGSGLRFASGMAGTTDVPGDWVGGNATDLTAQVGACAAAALADGHLNAHPGRRRYRRGARRGAGRVRGPAGVKRRLPAGRRFPWLRTEVSVRSHGRAGLPGSAAGRPLRQTRGPSEGSVTRFGMAS